MLTIRTSLGLIPDNNISEPVIVSLQCPPALAVARLPFTLISDSYHFSYMASYSFDSKFAGFCEATDGTTKWIFSLMHVTNGDGKGTGIKNPINKKAIYFFVSSDKSIMSW